MSSWTYSSMSSMLTFPTSPRRASSSVCRVSELSRSVTGPPPSFDGHIMHPVGGRGERGRGGHRDPGGSVLLEGVKGRSLCGVPDGSPTDLRLGEVLSALSLATDLGNGMPLEKTMRTCLLAVSVGGRLGSSDQDLSATFYATLLRSIGCPAFASEAAAAYGNDIVYRNTYFPVDFAREDEIVTATRTNLARDEPTATREAAVERFFADGPRMASEMAATACSVAVRFAARLGMGPAVSEALTQIWERWDGEGFPQRLAGEEIGIAARLIHLATVAEIDHRSGGSDVAVSNVRRRRGGWFDPDVADAFLDG